MNRNSGHIGSAFFLIVVATAIVWGFGNFRRLDESSSGASPLADSTPLAVLTSGTDPGSSVTPYPQTTIPLAATATPMLSRAAGSSATPIFRPGTGGPYISEAEALNKALKAVGAYGIVDAGIRPTAVFTTGRYLRGLMGDPEPEIHRGVVSERELWVVVFHGQFTPASGPRGRPNVVFRRLFLVFDATTGLPSGVSMREQVP